MNKNEQFNVKKSKELLYFFPMFCILAVIPLISFALKVRTNLEDKPWYSDSDTVYDLFLYAKSIAIIIIGLVSLLLLGYVIYTRWFEKNKNKTRKRKERVFVESIPLNPWFFVPLLAYSVFVLLSTFLSEDIGRAVTGGIDQWEGMLVLLSYVIMAVYGYYFIIVSDNKEKLLDRLAQTITVGSCVLSGIGAFQFFTLDFFKSGLGHAIVTMFASELQSSPLKFSFEENRAYTTLYNPNYVGSYVAVMLPVVIACILVTKKMWVKITGVLSVLFMLLALAGSESLTGCIGIAAAVVFFFLMMIPKMKKYYKPIICVVAGCVILAGVFSIVKRDAVQFAIDKIFNPLHNDYQVQQVKNAKEKGVEIRTNHFDMYADFDGSSLSFRTMDGENIETTAGAEKYQYIVTKDNCSPMKFTIKQYEVTGKTERMFGFRLECQGNTWDFVKDGENYKFFTQYGKLDTIRQIDSFGFEHRQHFASRRGFIWSRTIPLLSKNIIWGAGPDSFILEFPNDDYIGMAYNGYSGNIVTKPHNMFLQIAVQTGIFSLLAFLIVFLYYLVQSIRLYFRMKEFTPYALFGNGIMFGIFGYVVTGLANDSTNTVAPIYWLLLGLGTGVNYLIRKNQMNCEEGK